MTLAIHTVPDAQRSTAAALRELLPALVALALNAKQAHWNVIGSRFMPLHALTDDIATDCRVWADEVAERVAALDVAVDGRPAKVAAAAGPFPAGRIQDTRVITELVSLIDAVSMTTRSLIRDLGNADPVAHDLTVRILGGLDKYRWLLRAQEH